MGGAKGIVCVWLAGIVLTFFQCRGAFAELFSAMERTLLQDYFYENNILLQLILTIFTWKSRILRAFAVLKEFLQKRKKLLTKKYPLIIYLSGRENGQKIKQLAP